MRKLGYGRGFPQPRGDCIPVVTFRGIDEPQWESFVGTRITHPSVVFVNMHRPAVVRVLLQMRVMLCVCFATVQKRRPCVPRYAGMDPWAVMTPLAAPLAAVGKREPSNGLLRLCRLAVVDLSGCSLLAWKVV